MERCQTKGTKCSLDTAPLDLHEEACESLMCKQLRLHEIVSFFLEIHLLKLNLKLGSD